MQNADQAGRDLGSLIEDTSVFVNLLLIGALCVFGLTEFVDWSLDWTGGRRGHCLRCQLRESLFCLLAAKQPGISPWNNGAN